MEWLCLEASWLGFGMAPLYTWVHYGLILLGITALFGWTYRKYKYNYRAEWYRPDAFGVGLEPDWNDVRLILRKDPLIHEPSLRVPSVEYFLVDCAKFMLSVIVIGVLSDIFPSIAEGACCPDPSANADSQTFIIYLIGGFTLLITFLMAFIQVRAKVKSANRQKWIDKFRDTLSAALENMPKNDDIRRIKAGKKLDSKLRNKIKTCSKHVWLLELMINPSEKDHRTLITMLRMLQAPYHAYDLEQPLKVDEEVLRNIEILRDRNLYDTAYYKGIENDRDKLLTQTINLFHAVLKKEWERVKRGI